METRSHSVRKIAPLALIAVLLSTFNVGLKAQEPTEGTLTFAVRTVTANGNFSPRHVLAIWLEDADGFVLTRKLNADRRKQYLYTWNGTSGGNVTDATTGATLSSHQSHSISWDCLDKDGALVPDGEYTVYVEFTEAHAQGPLKILSFTKGPVAVELTPEDDANFKDMTLQFEPMVSVTAGFTFVADELLVNFTSTSTSTGARSYEWDFGDDNTSQEENPSHTYASPGTYSVSLKATSGSVSDTEIKEVTVTSTVGTGGTFLNVPHIYPNPTSGIFTISLDKDAGISFIKIYASNGGLVYSREIEGKDSHQVNIEAYESGTYILKVKSSQGSYSQKIVKE